MDFGQLGEMGSCLASPFEECILLKRSVCENECVQRLLRARTDAASIARRTCQSVNGLASGHSLSWNEADNGSSEDLFHGHGSGKHTRLSLDDLLDEIVDMVGVLVVGREEPGVLEEAFCLVGLGADGEDGGEQDRELFGAHGLNFEGVVDRRNIQQGARLPWERKLCYSQFPRAHQPAPSCVAGSSGRSSGGSEGCSDGQV